MFLIVSLVAHNGVYMCAVDSVSTNDVQIAMDTAEEPVAMDTTAEPVEITLRSVPVVASRMSLLLAELIHLLVCLEFDL